MKKTRPEVRTDTGEAGAAVPMIPDKSKDELMAEVRADMAANGEGEEPVEGNPIPTIILVPDKDLCARNTPLPPYLIEGLVYRGDVVLHAAPSKAKKSWLALQAQKCIGSGLPFLGMKTTQGTCIFLNTEIKDAFWEDRCRAQNMALGIDSPTIYHATTRGMRLNLHTAIPAIEKAIKETGLKKVDLLTVDPFYTLADGLDENTAKDVGPFMLDLQALAEGLDAALWITHHYAKGNALGKAVWDRMSGSGVFARAPDNILTVTENADKKTILEAMCRSSISPEPMEIAWEYPIFRYVGVAESTAPASKAGAPNLYNLQDLLRVYKTPEETIGRAGFMAALRRENGPSEDSIDRYLSRARAENHLQGDGRRGYQLTPQGVQEWRDLFGLE